MSRVSLECRCGRAFFVEAEVGGRSVLCPSCGDEVPVPIRLSPVPIRGGMLALAAVLGVGAAGAMLFLMLRRPPPENTPRKPGTPTPMTRSTEMPVPVQVAPPVPANVPPPPPPAPPPSPPVDVRTVGFDVERLNTAGILVEVLRRRGEAVRAREVEAQMREWEEAVDRATAAATAARRPILVPPRLRPGDVLVRFGEEDVDRPDPARAALYLADFLANRLAPGTTVKCLVLRGRAVVQLLLAWPACSDEIRALAATVGNAPAPESDGTDRSAPSPGRPAAGPLPPELLAGARGLLDGIPAPYLRMLRWDERLRLDRLLKDGQGTPEDVAFLQQQILEDFAGQVRSATDEIDRRIASLRRSLEEVPATDVLILKDGTRLEGRILEERPDDIRFERRSGGLRAAVTARRGDLSRIERGGGPGREWPGRLRAAGDDPPALAALLEWCGENRLADAADLVAWMILRRDPDAADARRCLGHARDAAGAWRPIGEILNPVRR